MGYIQLHLLLHQQNLLANYITQIQHYCFDTNQMMAPLHKNQNHFHDQSHQPNPKLTLRPGPLNLIFARSLHIRLQELQTLAPPQ